MCEARAERADVVVAVEVTWVSAACGVLVTGAVVVHGSASVVCVSVGLGGFADVLVSVLLWVSSVVL